MAHKIGLYFGSFNPIHYGHINIARYCLEHIKLDDIYFVVSPQNPFKDKKTLADFNDRFTMVQLVCHEYDDLFFATDIENTLDYPSYTANTLRELIKINKESEYYLILGSDNFLDLDKWKDSYYIKSFPMVVIPRLDKMEEIESFKEKLLKENGNDNIIIAKDFKPMNISSTMIRDKISKLEDYSNLTPKYIMNYIKQNNLYY